MHTTLVLRPVEAFSDCRGRSENASIASVSDACVWNKESKFVT